MDDDHIDLGVDLAAFRDEVLVGLASNPKTLPCKFFYDQKGSLLFDAITELAEYYPTRTEVGILQANIREIVDLLGAGCVLIEYGSGSSNKTRILLDHLPEPAGYLPIDISRRHLLETAEGLRASYPRLTVLPIIADYSQEFVLPEGATPGGRKAVFFPGSTLGNFHEPEAIAFLARIARVVGPGGGLLIGLDLKKDAAVLEAAYDDREGVTAAFNLNLLERINRELGGRFIVEQFRHRARYDRASGRVEMHLVSAVAQTVAVGTQTFAFAAGETIWTESSYKYDLDQVARMGRAAGLEVTRVWTDSGQLFSVHFMTAT